MASDFVLERVVVYICKGCLDGAPEPDEECHTPGCLFCFRESPGGIRLLTDPIDGESLRLEHAIQEQEHQIEILRAQIEQMRVSLLRHYEATVELTEALRARSKKEVPHGN